MKLIQVFKASNAMCKVVWNVEYSEYICKLYKVNGFSVKHVANADYFTDDKTDALNTARLMLANIK